MKSVCICAVFAAIKTSLPIFLLSPCTMCCSWGLYNAAALWSAAEHPPFVPRMANSAGTQPNGPVPVTITLRAPRSYSLCNNIYVTQKSNYHMPCILIFFGYKSLIIHCSMCVCLMGFDHYQQEFTVLYNEVFDIILQRILARPCRIRHQVVIVYEIVATNSDEDQCLIDQCISPCYSN